MHSQHHRFAIWNLNQHPYRHTLAEFSYANPSLPGVTNVESAINYLTAVLYPNTKAAVADVTALNALVGNTLNDFRVVLDDGDGKAAAYRWEQREGDATASWYKIYDMDWGVDSILSQFHAQTQGLYVFKYGNDDLDSAGAVVAGTFAGQRIYGGISASTNLTLSPNAGDGAGAVTGYVQVTNHFRPTTTDVFTLGTSALKFKDLNLSGNMNAGTLTAASGALTDSSGTISLSSTALTSSAAITGTILTGTTSLKASSGGTLMTISASAITAASGSIAFGSANFTGVGTIASGTHTISADLALSTGSIISSSGAITFSSNNLTTTGQVNAGNLRLASQTLSSVSGGMVIVAASGVVDVQTAMTTLGIAATGVVSASTSVSGGNLKLLGNILSSTDTNGNITFTPNGAGVLIASALLKPGSDNALDLGLTGTRFRTIYLGTSVGDGTNVILTGEVMSLRNNKFRDATRLSAVQNGDALFWDSTSGTWLASAPDTEITHSALSGLTTGDAGHTQFALLAGRSGGQTLQGGTAGSENLLLESTANASKGLIKAKDTFVPNTNASFSSTWSGTDLGGTSNYWNNVYTKGEFKNFRLENFATASIPAFSSQSIGRVTFDTDLGRIKFDTGAAIRSVFDLSQTLGIANGGTGQTAKAGAFDALSPMTTGGDLIYGGASGTGTRLANGTSSQWLKSGGGTAAPVWTAFTPPTVQRFLTGSGATYTTPAGVLWLKVYMIGGGGSGTGNGSGSIPNGNGGTQSNWKTSADVAIVVSTGAGAATGGSTTGGGTGGTNTFSAGAIKVLDMPGQAGSGAQNEGVASNLYGAVGGSAMWGGGGNTNASNSNGGTAVANSGSGGGGAGGGSNAGWFTGCSGGSGASSIFIITSPSATYHYTVGGGGAATSAGTGGSGGGGAGADGIIIVEEHYQ